MLENAIHNVIDWLTERVLMATLQSVLPILGEVEPLTVDESAAIFEGVVRRYLKMSSGEFFKRLDSGFFREHPELEHRLDSVLFYLPLIKR